MSSAESNPAPAGVGSPETGASSAAREAEELIAAAEPNEWTVEVVAPPRRTGDRNADFLRAIQHHEADVLDQGGKGTVASVTIEPDARLIAAAPRLLRALTGELRAAREEAAALRRERDEWRQRAEEARLSVLDALADVDLDAIHDRMRQAQAGDGLDLVTLARFADDVEELLGAVRGIHGRALAADSAAATAGEGEKG